MDTALLRGLEKYMFSNKNMHSYNKCIVVLERALPVLAEPVILAEPIKLVEPIILAEPIKLAEPTKLAEPPKLAEPTKLAEPAKVERKTSESFIPFQKDKLFWCFYVLLHGFSEYEMHRTGHYALEKAFKISSVEKLRTMKKEIKELKLKINEIEDELVNKEQITLKGLQVLCLVYKVSLTYIYGKKYCEFLYGEDKKDIIPEKHIIQQNNKKEHALFYEESVLDTITQTHWYIENAQKPLKAPSAYTLKDLQDICEKLEIPLKNTLGKSKTKKDLYEDILVKL